MSQYNNFIGIDIGKFIFVVAIHGDKGTKEYENNHAGILAFIRDFKTQLPASLVILETTGGYEMRLLLTLCDKNFAVHRADACKVKSFIRSFGHSAKTDDLDAKSLALYGFERSNKLELFTPQSTQTLALYELVQRRQDLKQMLVAEKNRLQAPRAELIKSSCEVIISTLTNQIDLITQEINRLIDNDPILKARKEIIKTVPGIGEITANDLLVLLPELGTLNRKQIASLSGLAPRANDSGRSKGYRFTGFGRKGIKPILFMSAMAARRSKSTLRQFYEGLIARGKKKMVAMVALMRKILVIANARLKYLPAN